MTSFHPEGVEDHLLLIASTRMPQDDGLPSQLRLKIPRSAAYFTGTGAAAMRNYACRAFVAARHTFHL